MNKILIILLFPIIAHATMYLEPPADFQPTVEAAGFYLEYDNKVLLLHRQDEKSQGNRWGIPAGKVDAGETPIVAAVRETYEETGFEICQNQATYLCTVYLRSPEKDCIFHMFSTKLNGNPEDVKIRFTEHKGFTWVTPKEALDLHLMLDQDNCFKLVYPE